MSNHRSENRSGLFLSGLLIGTAIGTVAGVLFAPRTGRETRRLLKKSADALPELAEDLTSSVQFQAGRLSESALRSWDDTLTRLREAIAVGFEASQRVQLLDAIDQREGGNSSLDEYLVAMSQPTPDDHSQSQSVDRAAKPSHQRRNL
jgi:gas vesicle protein